MRISIDVPTKAQIIAGGFVVAVSGAGESWAEAQLGAYASARGVYVHHCDGRLLYVGKATIGEHGTFAKRLRREFQELAARRSPLHKLLNEQSQPIRTYCLDLQDLDMMVDAGPMELPPERKALIMEQVLIGLYSPPGNVL